MRKIGLIGGMSFEGSAIYYRLINEAVRRQLGGLHSAELLLDSVDFQRIVDMQRSDRWDEAGGLLAVTARRLESAGVEAALMCAVMMHRVAEPIEAALAEPFLYIVDATAERLQAASLLRPLLLATRYTMEGTFYAERMARSGIEVMTPDAPGRDETHRIIFEELCVGHVLDSSRDILLALIAQAQREGADSVTLGCTEICLILDPEQLPLPGSDSIVIHAEKAVAFASGH